MNTVSRHLGLTGFKLTLTKIRPFMRSIKEAMLACPIGTPDCMSDQSLTLDMTGNELRETCQVGLTRSRQLLTGFDQDLGGD